MFPEPALPDAAFALAPTAGRNAFIAGQKPREPRLDQSPARREIGIASGQRPQAVQMFRQYHDGIHHERVIVSGQMKRLAELRDVPD